MAIKTEPMKPWLTISRLISIIVSRIPGSGAGANVLNSAAISVPGQIRREHDRPQAQQTVQILPGGLGNHRQDRRYSVFGEQLLARQHDQQETERIAEPGQQRTPCGVRQILVQDRFREYRKADRQPGGDTGPPQRDRRPRHLRLALVPHDLIDLRNPKPRVVGDLLDLVLDQVLVQRRDLVVVGLKRLAGFCVSRLGRGAVVVRHLP